MKSTKPEPAKSKLALREPAQPLAERPINPDHPAALIFAEVIRAQESESQPQARAESASSTTYHLPPTNHPPPTTQPIAPERDFMRVPNSVVRNAVPSGLFKGESKKLYDALYHRTRGSIVPRRSVRATHADLMDWACVSHNTLKSHLKHLSKVGLLKVHYVRGDNTGAEYEVFTPEEALPTTHHPSTNHPLATTQNLAPPTSQNLVSGGGSYPVEESTSSEDRKTSFKTNKEYDDDAARLLAKLQTVEREVTGKTGDPSKWAEPLEIVLSELKVAASRATQVSSAPAFLAEHLRRRLWKKDKKQIEVEQAEAAAVTVERHLTPEEISTCTDCHGEGHYYPEGYEKGIKFCKHEKLTK